jgi:hypothetical protein
MSPTALRWLAVPLGLAAFAANMVRANWFDPLTYEMSSGWGMAAGAAGMLVALGVPVGAFIVLGYRRPASFQRARGRLVAPADPTQAGLAILWMGLAGQVPFEAGHLPVRLTNVAFFAALAAAAMLIQRPRLELDVEGLTIHHIRRVTRIEWDRLAPGGPLPPTRKRPRYLRLYLDEPPLYDIYPPSVDVPMAWLHVDPKFLADTIRRYVEHPEERAALPGGGKPQGAPSI